MKQKLKLYLDTSVISHIEADDVPEKEACTKQFFRQVAEHGEEYELFVSPVVEEEVNCCSEPKRSRLFQFLREVELTLLEEDAETICLAQLYLDGEVLGKKHYRDLLHIAYAVISHCDYIISWNFKHFVNIQTITRVNTVNRENHLSPLFILSPEAFIGESYVND